MSPRNDLHTLQQLVTAFSLIERHHLIPGTERHETDVEHSFSVALLAWFICDKYNLPLDREKVLKYALSLTTSSKCMPAMSVLLLVLKNGSERLSLKRLHSSAS